MKFSRRAWIRTIIYGGLAAAGGAGYYSSKRLEILRADVPIPDLKKNLDGIKIGVMSDFHAGAFLSGNDLHEAISALQREKPDIIALLGDYVDGAYSHSSRNVAKGSFLFESLKGLEASLGVYAVLGNHDHWTDAAKVKTKLSEARLTILNNQNITLDEKFAVAGVDDFWEGPANASRALKDLRPDTVTIMLSHNPDINIQIAGDPRVRLVLSGHTHGGQIRVPFINYAPWVPCSSKYRGYSGLIRETAKRRTFITKGVGTFFVPVRLACPPDIGILRLRRV
jgi:predicted MPP superfamily phosphohydrolase